MNTQHFNQMTDRVSSFLSTELGDHDFNQFGTFERMSRLLTCIEASLVRELSPGNQHWFVVTSCKALRAAYHGLVEGDGVEIPTWPTFDSAAPATEIIRRCAAALLGVELRIDNDETTVVLLNMRMIRGRGYRLSPTKFTEPLNEDTCQ